MLIRKEEKWGCGGRYPRRFVCAWRLGPASKIGSWQLMSRCWSCQGSPSSWMAFLRVPQRSPGGFTGNWAVHTGIPSKIGVFPTNLCIAESLVSWLQYKLTVCTSLHPGVSTSTPHPLSSVTEIWNHHTNWKGMLTCHCGLEWMWDHSDLGVDPTCSKSETISIKVTLGNGYLLHWEQRPWEGQWLALGHTAEIGFLMHRPITQHIPWGMKEEEQRQVMDISLH